MHVCIHACACVHVHACLCEKDRKRVCVCVCVCVQAHMHVCVGVCTISNFPQAESYLIALTTHIPYQSRQFS